MDPRVLHDLDTDIARRLPNTYSMLVIRHGYLVVERYYHGLERDALMELKSVTKSVTATLIGAALLHGYLHSLDQTVAEFFPELMSPTVAPHIRATTIRQLLTMCSGWYWPAERPGAPAAGAFFRRMTRSDDWLQFIFDLPVKDHQRRFCYKEIDAHVVSAILTRATGMTALRFADTYLFDPLGIKAREWDADPQRYNTGSGGLRLRARDLAKIGRLHLRDGVWAGARLLAPGWVAAATADQSGANYGFYWWLTEDRGYRSYTAQGYGGQILRVIPELDLVVTFTSNPTHIRYADPAGSIARCIVPAIRDNGAGA
jgi:CubicO group peptidase (beta-lactamase class C family)